MTISDAVTAGLREALAHPEAPSPGPKVVVALSGGLDSCVLLHLLRFEEPGRFDLIAAHFDHGMRPGSDADARWVRGLCLAWDVPLEAERASAELASENAARDARYSFLERVRARTGASAVLTAHHADDQAETVLFRVLRGTGISGLAGIPRSREGTVFRPLLELWRGELEAYAQHVRLTWREDASNAEVTFARNAIRHRLLPDAERLVAPGARRALVRLARVAAAEESALAGLLSEVLRTLDVEDDEEGCSLDRDGLSALDPAVRSRVLRALAARLGLALDESGTRSAVAFSSFGRSGTGIELGGGFELRRRLDRLALVRPAERRPDSPLTIPDAGPGRGEAWVGGRCFRVFWGDREATRQAWFDELSVSLDRFPLVVRGRVPGDRLTLPGGTKKLKKVLLEARVPADGRERVPVVVDRLGEILWVPGVARPVAAGEGNASDTLMIGIG